MRISRELLSEVVAHAREEAPNECCGMIATSGGRAVAVHRAVNVHASPLRYEIGSDELLRLSQGIEEAGYDIGAIYHSHTRTPPFPSQTDINFAQYPDSLYVILGLANDELDVRAFHIRDGEISEAALEVED